MEHGTNDNFNKIKEKHKLNFIKNEKKKKKIKK